jgi:hypothetical protein
MVWTAQSLDADGDTMPLFYLESSELRQAEAPPEDGLVSVSCGL